MAAAPTLPDIGKAQGVDENDAETEAAGDSSPEAADNGPTGGTPPEPQRRTRARRAGGLQAGALPGVPTNMPQLAPQTLQGLGLLFVLARASGTSVELMAEGMRTALAAFDALNTPPQE